MSFPQLLDFRQEFRLNFEFRCQDLMGIADLAVNFGLQGLHVTIPRNGRVFKPGMQQIISLSSIVVPTDVIVVFASGASDTQTKTGDLPMSMQGKEGLHIIAHALEIVYDGLPKMEETIGGCALQT